MIQRIGIFIVAFILCAILSPLLAYNVSMFAAMSAGTFEQWALACLLTSAEVATGFMVVAFGVDV